MKRIDVATIVALLSLPLLLITSSGCSVPCAEEQARFVEAYERIRFDVHSGPAGIGRPIFRGSSEDDVIALLGSDFTVNSDTASGMGRMRTLTWRSGSKVITVNFRNGTATDKGKRGF